jgi:hypothetical protein
MEICIGEIPDGCGRDGWEGREGLSRQGGKARGFSRLPVPGLWQWKFTKYLGDRYSRLGSETGMCWCDYKPPPTGMPSFRGSCF